MTLVFYFEFLFPIPELQRGHLFQNLALKHSALKFLKALKQEEVYHLQFSVKVINTLYFLVQFQDQVY
jgi:hypothetical protein